MAGKKETPTKKTTAAALINDAVISDSEQSDSETKPTNTNKPEPESESEENSEAEEEAEVEESEDENVNKKNKIDKTSSGKKLNGNGKVSEKKAKTKGKGKGKEKEIENTEGENGEYKIPMRRISRIIKDGDADIRISHEATFLINKATEKFLEVFTREAYSAAYLDRKNQVAYNHLSSIVAKRSRFDFLADLVPEKVKAEDALAKFTINDK